jgi:hypothetical protein
MAEQHLPPGWSHNPSAWSGRLLVPTLALAGCAIATYLGLYQLGLVHRVWEPFFGDGSHRILKGSAVAHLLPVPDALLGAAAYFLEALAGGIGGRNRWRTRPWVVLGQGCLAAGLGVVGIALVLCQAFWFHAWCTLCLASAGCSVAIAGAVLGEGEFLAALTAIRRRAARRSPYGKE